MQNFFNKISIKELSNNLNLIYDKLGIALSSKPLIAKDYDKLINKLYFVEEIILIFIRNGYVKLKINLYEVEITTNSIVNLVPNDTIKILEYSKRIRS